VQLVGGVDAGLHRRAASAPERPDHLHLAVCALGHARRLAGQDRTGGRLRVFGVGFAVALEVAALGPFHLDHRDSHVLQVAGQTGPVAAGPFHPGAPYGAEPFRPTEEVAVAPESRGCLRLAQAPAQVVEYHRHVEVQVSVHPQHHLDHIFPSTCAAPRHSRPAPFRCRRQLLPDV
jgi:hypothetical protein